MPANILCVRLGAMGDILHTMPAVASLRASFPSARITWLVERRWMPLLAGNPQVSQVLPFERGGPAALLGSARRIRAERFDLAVDFQGLIKSSLAARASGAQVEGFRRTREAPATWLYHRSHDVSATHVVDRNLQLAEAAGARVRSVRFHIPPGRPEGELPAEPFVLANPFAGWGSKQWPLERYSELATWLAKGPGLPLVVNGSPDVADRLRAIQGARAHVSGLDGLIDATRRAAAVVGVDSGPMHLAAALGVPGVAIFGPTDPARNGPYGQSFAVLRADGAETSYRRGADEALSMQAVTAADAGSQLERRLAACRK